MKRKSLKKLVVGFCKRKHEILLAITGLELYTPSDFQYISLLKKKEYIEFLNGMKNRKPLADSDDDTISCIYCCVTDCDKCFYGLYHGQCNGNSHHNTYELIIDKLMNDYCSFSAIPAIKALEKEYVEMYNILFTEDNQNGNCN